MQRTYNYSLISNLRKRIAFCFALLALLLPHYAHSQTALNVQWSYHPNWNPCISCSPDGKQVAIAGLTQQITLLDAKTGQLLGNLYTASIPCLSIQYSADSHQLATLGYANSDKTNVHALLEIWDVPSLKKLSTIITSLTNPSGLDWSPNGKWIVTFGYGSGSSDPCEVWEVSSGTLQFTIPDAKANRANCARFSPNSKLLAVSGTKARLWDVTTWKLKASFQPSILFYDMAYSPDSKYLSGTNEQGKMETWRMSDRVQMCATSLAKPITYLIAYAPQKPIVAIGDDNWTVQLRNALTGDLTGTIHTREYLALENRFTPDGKSLVVASANPSAHTGVVQCFDLTNSTVLWSFECAPGDLPGFALSPNGQTFFVGGYTWDTATGQVNGGVLQRRNTKTGKLIANLPLPTKGIANYLTVSNNGNLLLAQLNLGATVYDIPTQRALYTLPHSSVTPHNVGFSPNSRYLALDDKGVSIYDARTGALVQNLATTIKPYNMHTIAWSPNSKMIGIAGVDGTTLVVECWNVTTGAKIQTVGSSALALYTLAFSPDNRRILAGGKWSDTSLNWHGSVEVWNISNGKSVSPPTLLPNTLRVLSLCYSPDGLSLYVGCSRSIQVFNTSDFSLVRYYEYQRVGAVSLISVGEYGGIHFSQDGTLISFPSLLGGVIAKTAP